MSWKKLGLLLFVVAGLAFVAGCSDDDTTAPNTTDQFGAVREAFDAYLSSGAAPTVSSTALFGQINDTNPDNRPFVVSVRSPEIYAIGHVPGAINIPWREVANSASLALLPTDRQIAVYCYTGHTGQLATTALTAMGYDAVNMKFGMVAWSKDPAIRGTSPFTEPAQSYATETTINTLTETYDFPDLDVSSSTDAGEIVVAALQSYLPTGSPVITAATVFENLNDGNPDNDFFVVSVRSAEHYALGHVPGAYNIPWREIAKEENLSKLPTDRTIVLYCYTGHTGQVATTVLSALGYDAINMKFGIMAWTTDPAVRVASPFAEADYPDYGCESGSGS